MISIMLRSRSSVASSRNETSNAERRSSTGVLRRDDVVRRNRSMNGTRSRSIIAVSTSVLFLKCQYTAPRV